MNRHVGSLKCVLGALLILVAQMGCAQQGAAPAATMRSSVPAMRSPALSRSRPAFAEEFAKVKTGMTAAEVEAILGKPDDLKTQQDGIELFTISEIWRYGTNRHLGPATLGSVWFNKGGKVEFARGTKGGEALVAKLGETEVRRLLEVIDAGTRDGLAIHPRLMIAAINAVRPLGKETGVLLMQEFLDADAGTGDSFDAGYGQILLMRALFAVPPPNDGPPASRNGEFPKVVYPGFFREPAFGQADWTPADPREFPLFPLVMVDDVPIVMVRGYMLGGMAEGAQEHFNALKSADWISKPLMPPADPMAIAAKVSKMMTAHGQFVEPRLYMGQLLKLVDTVNGPMRSPDGYDDFYIPGGDVYGFFDSVAANVRRMNIHWDAAKECYIRGDGSFDDMKTPRYQQQLFTVPEQEGQLRTTVTLARHNAEWINVSVSHLYKKPSPPRDVRLRILGADGRVLNEANEVPRYNIILPMSSLADTDWILEAGFRCKVPQREKLHVEITVNGKTFKSEVMTP